MGWFIKKILLTISYTFNITGSLLPVLEGSNSSFPLSFDMPRQLGNGKLQGRPLENIFVLHFFYWLKIILAKLIHINISYGKSKLNSNYIFHVHYEKKIIQKKKSMLHNKFNAITYVWTFVYPCVCILFDTFLIKNMIIDK